MPLCPECGAEVEATDTHCMECGADLIAAKEKERRQLEEQSLAARRGQTGNNSATAANAGARGVMGVGDKSSDETRLREFDRHEAERLKQERVTAWVTAALGFVAFVALVLIGYARIKAGGGLGQIPSSFTPASLRHGTIDSPTVVGTLLTGTGIAALLIAIGQVNLARKASMAITDVENNRKPTIASVSQCTILGLFLLSIFCPPLGLIAGGILRFGRNPDLKSLGGRMMTVSIGLMVLVALNFGWGMIGGDQAAAKAAANAPD